MGCWLEAALWSLPCGPLLREAHSKAEEAKREHKQDRSHRPCELLSEMTSHHFCSILFVSRYNVPSRGDYTRVWIPRGRIVGQYFSSSLPQQLYVIGVLSFFRKGIWNSEILLRLTRYLSGSNLNLNESFSKAYLFPLPHTASSGWWKALSTFHLQSHLFRCLVDSYPASRWSWDPQSCITFLPSLILKAFIPIPVWDSGEVKERPNIWCPVSGSFPESFGTNCPGSCWKHLSENMHLSVMSFFSQMINQDHPRMVWHRWR